MIVPPFGKTLSLAAARAGCAAAIGALAFLAPSQTPQARVSGPTPPLARAPDGRSLVLSFDQSFAAPNTAPPSRVWRTTFGDGQGDTVDSRTIASNGELQVYVDPGFGGLGLNPFQVHDGVLSIIASPATPTDLPKLGGRRYASGLISTQPSFSQLYGYFEIRAKLPRGKGLWPALWMLPADLTWPPEIDIMESTGDPRTAYASVHTKVGDGFTQSIPLPDEGFHTFAVSWDPRVLAWYVDGREVVHKPTPPDMHKPMYLLANLAVGGQWAGTPDETTQFPASFSIQYVRAYRFQ